MSQHLLICFVFLVGSAPLVWQDTRESSASQALLFAVLALWSLACLSLSASPESALALSAGVLAFGTVGLLLFPDWFGAADIIYMAGLAWLLPFWSFLLAIAVACTLGLISFGFLSHWGRRDISGLALPFLPSLALGGFFVLGGRT